MSSEVEKYNPTTIMKNVTDKIKVTFAELIPDEEWEKLVQKQINMFMEDKRDQWGKEQPSEFTKMAQEILRELAREHIKTYMSAHFEQKFDKNNKLIEDAVKDMITNNASAMFASMMAQAAQQAVWNMQSQITNQPRGY